MNIGVIGTGNMGTIIIESLIEGSVLSPSQLYITNRTLEKAEKIKQYYPEIKVLNNVKSVAQSTDILFICVKPLQIEPLLNTLKTDLTDEQLLVSITSPITVSQLESAVPSKVARVIPSITNRALSGATLFTFGDRCDERDKVKLKGLFENISTPIMIDEPITRIASDLSSCGPAFMSFLLEKMINAAVSVTEISKEQAIALTTEMMIGFGKLLEKDFYTLETLKQKVHVKGGVTGVGLKVLEDHTEGIFEKVFAETQNKFKEDHAVVDVQFSQEVSE
ncbi:competence protein ComER [Pullulanibacillus pueri]|uniref:Pyrroline-5-carboxylate reductase n=2 Tax=Pullulanibacillus pueri TaxID=1437324 RepID=A0A8J3EMX2_9BACL|nr:late competence protein ComER [Pullulanibacillus pueri]MBM7683072.1 competence protein ComER [Pullulanibacillus pueri]GGH84892.1 pyrroline-5-carboxylate reductase [Pullulanibacillus pueri]